MTTITHSTAPLNAEPTLSSLLAHDRTPTSLLYHRNHGAFPEDARSAVSTSQSRRGWVVELIVEEGIEGFEGIKKEVELGEIMDQENFKEEEIALQCAGNRRSLFSHTEGDTLTEGLPWESGTIANVSWGGSLLLPLLQRYLVNQTKADEIRGKNLHIVFESSQDCGSAEGGVFGGSTELDTVLDESNSVPVMLCWKQNGEDLSLEHGGPVRCIVPGYIGARSVKWLKRISISSRPSQHHAQQKDYKILLPSSSYTSSPSTSTSTPHSALESIKKEMISHKQDYLDKTNPMGWMEMQCVCGEARWVRDAGAGEEGKKRVRVKGYAVGEKGIPITKIQLSLLRLSKSELPSTLDSITNTLASLVPSSIIPSSLASASKQDQQSTHHTAQLEEQLTERAELSGKWVDLDLAAKGSKSEQTERVWSWVLWEGEVDFEEQSNVEDDEADKSDYFVMVARAVDHNGKVQERWPKWNLRGVGFDGWSVRDVDSVAG